MRVASFNLRYDCPADSVVGPWKERKAEVVRAFQAIDCDVIGTQEGLKHQLDDLMAVIGGQYSWSGKGRDGNGAGEHCAIFWRKDRWNLKESGTFWLSETPDVEGSRSWGSACNRVASYVVLTPNREESSRVLFVSTHLDHQSQEARVKGAKLVVEKAKSLALWFNCRNTVIVGDFNSDPRLEKGVYAEFQKSPLRDAFLEAPERINTEIGTFHGWQGPCSTGQRIDWVWIGGYIKATKSEVYSVKGDKYWPSDHFPVVCHLLL